MIFYGYFFSSSGYGWKVCNRLLEKWDVVLLFFELKHKYKKITVWGYKVIATTENIREAKKQSFIWNYGYLKYNKS